MILKFDGYFHHVLKFCEDNGPTARAEIREKVLNITGVTADERAIVNEKGTFVAKSRISWLLHTCFKLVH